MRLTVRELPIKFLWLDASLALRNFSPSNEFWINLSTTKAIYFSLFVFAMHALAPIGNWSMNTFSFFLMPSFQSRFPLLIYNNRAAEEWICLASKAATTTFLLKRNSNTGVFLWHLQKFLEHLFWSISSKDCFSSFFFVSLCSLFTS